MNKYNFLNVLFCLLIFVFLENKFITPVDIWWHLQVGKDIVSGNWPSPDSYSYISSNGWVVNSWLCDIFFYSIWRIENLFGMGEECIILLKYSVKFIFVWLIFCTTLKQTKSILLSYILFIMAVSLISHMTPRPYIFSPLFFYYYYLLFKNGDFRFIYSIYPYLLFVLWVNTHGAFIIILLILPVYLFYFCIRQWLINGKPQVNHWLHFLVFLLLLYFLNPHPVDLLYRILDARAYPSLDWKSAVWWTTNSPRQMFSGMIIYSLTLAAYLILYFKCCYNERYFNSPLFISDIFCFLLPLASVRFIWLIIFPALNIVVHLSKIYTESSRLTVGNIVSIIAIILLFYNYQLYDTNRNVFKIITGQQLQTPSKKMYEMPSGALENIKKNNLSGNVFCPWFWSGYITWNTNKKLKIFVDTRIEPFELSYIHFHFMCIHSPFFAAMHLSDFNTDYILVQSDNKISNWKLLEKNGYIDIIHYDNISILAKFIKVSDQPSDAKFQ